MSVTYGAGGNTRKNTVAIAKGIQDTTGVTTIAHLTCVGATASTELCVITEGSAEIEDAQGRKTLVKPGDAFIIPQGSRTVWRIEEYVKKYYLCVLDLED